MSYKQMSHEIKAHEMEKRTELNKAQGIKSEGMAGARNECRTKRGFCLRMEKLSFVGKNGGRKKNVWRKLVTLKCNKKLRLLNSCSEI